MTHTESFLQFLEPPGGLACHLDFLGEHSRVQQAEKAKPRQPNNLSPGFATSAPQTA